jgi:hypothetical protein
LEDFLPPLLPILNEKKRLEAGFSRFCRKQQFMSPPKGLYFLTRGDLALFKLQEAGTGDLHFLNCFNLVPAAE